MSYSYTFLILILLHITLGALWFGGPLVVGRLLKTALPKGRDTFAVAAEVAGAGARLAVVGNIGVLLTGVALIFERGGFAAVKRPIHIALLLVLIGLGLAIGLIRPTVSRLVEGARSEAWKAADAEPLIGRLAMAVGINHLLWLATLVMMFLR